MKKRMTVRQKSKAASNKVRRKSFELTLWLRIKATDGVEANIYLARLEKAIMELGITVAAKGEFWGSDVNEIPRKSKNPYAHLSVTTWKDVELDTPILTIEDVIGITPFEK